MNGAVDIAVTGGSTAVAVLALVVAYLARRDARRAADAAEESVRQARRSADADERAVELAAREAEQRDAVQHDADGPRFDQVEGRFSYDATARFVLRVVGGPGRLTVTVQVNAEWCSGFVVPDSAVVSSDAMFDVVEVGEIVGGIVELVDPVGSNRTEITLPLIVVAESDEQPPRTWTRHVPVMLERAVRVW